MPPGRLRQPWFFGAHSMAARVMLLSRHAHLPNDVRPTWLAGMAFCAGVQVHWGVDKTGGVSLQSPKGRRRYCRLYLSSGLVPKGDWA